MTNAQRRALGGFFFLLFLFHLLASWARVPMAWRQGLWITGMLLAFAWIRSAWEGKKEIIDWGKDRLGLQPSAALVGVLLASGLLLRCSRFWPGEPWPLWDEYFTAKSGLQLSQHWDWKFFYSFGQSPPLLNWMVGALLRLTDHVFFSLWFPSFLLSAATAALGYGAARQFFSKSLSFLCLSLLALEYWPLFCGSLALQQVWLPFWQCGVFYLFGKYGKAQGPVRLRWAALLGAWTGLGYWTYAAWIVVAVSAGLALLLSRGKERPGALAAFGLVFLCFFSHFLYLGIGENYFAREFQFSILSGWHSLGVRLLSSADYLNGLFWGHWSPTSIAPQTGGLLNPLEAALFWIGLWEIFRTKNQALTRWLVLSLALFLLPGILSQNLQLLRILALLPLALGLQALGAAKLLETVPAGLPRVRVLALFLVLLALGEGARMDSSFRRANGEWVSARRVHDTLRAIARDRGPGLLFTEFTPRNFQALEAAVYPFNASQNPRLDPSRARWAALLTNRHYEPFLRRRFPEARWWRPDPSGQDSDADSLVGLIPLGEGGAGKFRDWVRADLWFREGGARINDLAGDPSIQAAREFLEHPGGNLTSDPFLQSAYGERMADFYYFFGYQKNYSLQAQALERAAGQGYPAAHLYYLLGSLQLRKGDYLAAEKSLQTALAREPDYAEAREALSLLRTLEMKAAAGK